jgi:hypothetical protein
MCCVKKEIYSRRIGRNRKNVCEEGEIYPEETLVEACRPPVTVGYDADWAPEQKYVVT